MNIPFKWRYVLVPYRELIDYSDQITKFKATYKGEPMVKLIELLDDTLHWPLLFPDEVEELITDKIAEGCSVGHFSSNYFSKTIPAETQLSMNFDNEVEPITSDRAY